MTAYIHTPVKGYTNGCRCEDCHREHLDRQAAWRATTKLRAAALQAELAALRAWRDSVMATAPAATGEQVPA